MATIRVLSSDGVSYNIDTDVAKNAEYFRIMLDMYGKDNSLSSVIPVELPSDVLSRILTWMYHDHNTPNARSSSDDDLTQWEKQFFASNSVPLGDFAIAGKYLGLEKFEKQTIKTLVHRESELTEDDIRTAVHKEYENIYGTGIDSNNSSRTSIQESADEEG